jgi:hypothetical protein
MNWARSRSPLVKNIAVAATLVAAAWIARTANAQSPIIAIGPPSFQSNSYPSFEREILYRLSLGGAYQPDDLATLARLTVLESIAMLADIHADLPYNITAYQLEGQISLLGAAAQALYESVNSSPLNMPALTRAGLWFDELQAAYGRVDSMLGQFRGLSDRAATHLGDVARLSAAIAAVMRAAESELSANVPLTGRSSDMSALGTQARLLANEITGIIQNVKRSKHQGSAWDNVSRDLAELVAVVQDFNRVLAQSATNQEIESAFRAVRRRMWQAEARIAQLGWPPDLDRAWRGARARLNVITDGLGLPRVIARAQRSRPDDPAPSATPEKPATQIYRGPPQ